VLNPDGSVSTVGKPVSVSDIFASLGFVLAGTPKGQQFLAETGGSYVGATVKTNSTWLIIIAILTGLLIFVAVTKKK
jgi:hypothetical protein